MVNSDAPNRNSPPPRKSAVGCSAKGRSLVSVTLGLVLALGLALVLSFVRIVVGVRIAVFVFLYFGVLGRVLLSLGRVFGCVLLYLRSVFSRILVLSLCGARDHQTREGNTEQATSNESIQHFWSPVRNFVAHFYSTQ